LCTPRRTTLLRTLLSSPSLIVTVLRTLAKMAELVTAAAAFAQPMHTESGVKHFWMLARWRANNVTATTAIAPTDSVSALAAGLAPNAPPPLVVH